MKRDIRRALKQQKGIVLLLIVLSLLAVGATFLLVGMGGGLQATKRQIALAASSSDALLQAKLALIGYVASPPNSSWRPGTLPTPDSLANGIYDGREDGSCIGGGAGGLSSTGASSLTKRCVGKFPWKDLGFDLGDASANDATGVVPWLAISANLAYYDQCLLVLNSDSAKLNSPVTATCPTVTLPYPQPSSLPQPWLTVVDENGVVLSNRVAAVIVMPGPAIVTESRTQSRSNASPGNPADYLDDIRLPLGCTSGCTTYDNGGLNNTFVAIPPGTKYSLNAQDLTKRGQPIQFNDQLVYVTIDELVPVMERRVAGQMAIAARALKASSSFVPASFPWAAEFVAAPVKTTSLSTKAGTYFGMFPFMTEETSPNKSDYSSDFDWSISGFTETLSSTCRRISSGPNRYIKNTLANAIATPLSSMNIASGTSPSGKSTCQWKGTKRVACRLETGQTTVSTFQPTLTIYSNNTCTSVVGTNTLSVSRSITTADFDFNCPGPGAPTVSFTSASASDVHRWTWSCSTVAPTDVTILLAATDTVSNYGGTTFTLLPRTLTTSLVTPAGGTKQLTISRMRYHPIMPDWFHMNNWYNVAFYAVAPSSAPANLVPCGVAVTTLSAGAVSGIDAIAIVASSAIAPARPVVVGPPADGALPSSVVTDYLEGQNANGKSGMAPGLTNCSFSGTATPPSAVANDQVTVISP